MIDMRIVLVVLGIYGAVWAGQQVIDGTKYVGHQTKCGVMKIIGKHCSPWTKPHHDPVNIEVED